MIWYLFLGVILGLMSWILFSYWFFQGAFDDVEDIKYEMFRKDPEDKD